MPDLSNPPSGCRVVRVGEPKTGDWAQDVIEDHRAVADGTHPTFRAPVNYQQMFEYVFLARSHERDEWEDLGRRYRTASGDTERLRVAKEAFGKGPWERIGPYIHLMECPGDHEVMVELPNDPKHRLVVDREVLPASAWKACEILAWVHEITPQAIRKYVERRRRTVGPLWEIKLPPNWMPPHYGD